MTGVRRTQADRSASTRAALMAAGRELFARRGFDAVAAEDIVAAAGVTRGALYHHFDGKRGLFDAVFEQIERELVESFPLEELAGADPLGVVVESIDPFLRLSLTADVQRIALIDGPAVLGWERWHEIEARYGLGLIEAALRAAADAGQLRDDVSIPELAVALLGALIETALGLARADDPEAATSRASATLRAMVEGLASERR